MSEKANSNALVSIVIPCYKGARFLPEAIQSCQKQTHRNLEIIVVDDASPDDCARIAEDFARLDPRVRVVRRSANGGVSRAFNTGYSEAKGDYQTRLAQDDLFQEDAVSIMVRHLEQHPQAGLVYCDQQYINEQGEFLSRAHLPGPDQLLEAGNKFGLCFLWRKGIWEKVGGFNPQFDTAEDYDYLIRVHQEFSITHCSGSAPLFMRVHSGMGSQLFAARQELLGASVFARHCPNPIIRRKKLSQGHFNAGYIYRETGRLRDAGKQFLAAIWYWPFDARPYRSLVGLLLGAFAQRDSK
jgi:glycosyltransferase involved in cell wall biosynthesis